MKMKFIFWTNSVLKYNQRTDSINVQNEINWIKCNVK
jgi:hypothetical protein